MSSGVVRVHTGSFVSLLILGSRWDNMITHSYCKDADINYQQSEHILATALDTITNWNSFWDTRALLNPAWPFV